MSSAGTFPLPHPPEARSPFGSDAAARQLAKVARLEEGSRVLEIGAAGSSVGVLLSSDFFCEVTLAERDQAGLAAISASIDSEKLAMVETMLLDPASPGLKPGSFDCIILQARALLPLGRVIDLYRPLLAKNGRLALIWPTRVGRFPSETSVAYWEKRLGEKPPLPRELMMRLGAAGLEPESAESLSDTEMDELYRGMEPFLGKLSSADAAALREEMALHRSHNGKAGVAYTRVIARRREPGEKPPPARDRG